MDFNQAFKAYDTIEGANAQTVFGKKMTQKEAAIEAVTRIGLNQVEDVKKECFDALPEYYEMFTERLKVLKSK